MAVDPITPSDSAIPALAVRAPEACRILGIGERKLWELTNRKLIPHVRLGKSVLYPVQALNDWLNEQTIGGGQ